MGELVNLQTARKEAAIESDRDTINQCLAQIRATGWLVDVVDDQGSRVIVDMYDGAGECYQMLIDPAENRRWANQGRLSAGPFD